VGIVVFVVIVVQASFVSRFPVLGARGDIVLLVAIAAGLEGNAQRGAVVGFAAGLVFDLLLTSPAGLSALTYCLVAYLVGSFHASVLRSTWWIPLAATVMASALGVMLFALFDQVLGEATVEAGRLPAIVAVVAVLNGLLSRPARWAMRWALADTSRSRDRMFLR